MYIKLKCPKIYTTEAMQVSQEVLFIDTEYKSENPNDLE